MDAFSYRLKALGQVERAARDLVDNVHAWYEHEPEPGDDSHADDEYIRSILAGIQALRGHGARLRITHRECVRRRRLRAPAPLTTEGGVVPLTKQKGE
jgi:hypothetical protein